VKAGSKILTKIKGKKGHKQTAGRLTTTCRGKGGGKKGWGRQGLSIRKKTKGGVRRAVLKGRMNY